MTPQQASLSGVISCLATYRRGQRLRANSIATDFITNERVGGVNRLVRAERQNRGDYAGTTAACPPLRAYSNRARSKVTKLARLLVAKARSQQSPTPLETDLTAKCPSHFRISYP